MKEVGREAKVGQRLQDERREGHASGLGRDAQLSDPDGRNEHTRANPARGSPNLLLNGSQRSVRRTIRLSLSLSQYTFLPYSKNPFVSSAHCLYRSESSELCTIQAVATPY